MLHFVPSTTRSFDNWVYVTVHQPPRENKEHNKGQYLERSRAPADLRTAVRPQYDGFSERMISSEYSSGFNCLNIAGRLCITYSLRILGRLFACYWTCLVQAATNHSIAVLALQSCRSSLGARASCLAFYVRPPSPARQSIMPLVHEHHHHHGCITLSTVGRRTPIHSSGAKQHAAHRLPPRAAPASGVHVQLRPSNYGYSPSSIGGPSSCMR